MSNLERLIKKIAEDAQTEAKSILQEAEKQKEEIISQKSSEANEKVINMLIIAERDACLIKEQAISHAKIQARDLQLQAKGEVIQRVFSMVLERLTRLDQQEYLQFLKSQLKDTKLKGSEILVVPENRKDIVKDLDLPINLSAEESVESGFILIGDQYTLNHTFQSLVDFYQDELELEVAKVLFND